LRNLRELLIENTNIQGGLEHIAELPALTDLTIRSTNVTCKCFTAHFRYSVYRGEFAHCNSAGLPMTFAHMKGLRSLAVEKSLLSGKLHDLIT
jgi:hypothetical protein